MSQVLINRYLTELANLRKVGGTHRESVVSEAFKDLHIGYESVSPFALGRTNVPDEMARRVGC